MKDKYLVLIGLPVCALLACLIGSYSTLVKQDESVKEKTANLESTYQRRIDLIPNLVEVVKKYAEHESKTFTAVTEARAAISAFKPGTPEFNKANEAVGSSLRQLLVVCENYPQLKADTQFSNLQAELAGTENRINVARQDRAKAIKEYNSSKRGIFSSVVQLFITFPTYDNFSADPGASTVPRITL